MTKKLSIDIYNITMKITKYVHSCLYVEADGITMLIDPGEYSVKEKAISIDTFSHLDYLLITHEHADHFSLPFVKEMVAKFQNLTIITNSSVQKMLQKENIISQTEGNDLIQVAAAPHEKIFGGIPPENIVVTLFNRLTDPGDSLHFDKTAEILALPIIAPWGSVTDSVEKAIALKPKIIIPIHDWHWNEEARKSMYARLVDYFKQFDIEFKGIETGKTLEV